MSNKTIRRGFGVVRFLTPNSQKSLNELFHDENEGAAADEGAAGLDFSGRLRRRLPAHATIIGFVGMSRREQAAFQAGFTVSRLEEKLERGVQDEAPRIPLSVEIGSIATTGNFLYAELQDFRLGAEQREIAGQVAMHGINIQRINRKVLPPHLGIGFNQNGPIEETQAALQNILPGQTVTLERWRVYPDKYST